MSDLCLYELQDNVWDEFNEIDDHIVPRPADDTGDKCIVQSGSHKKVRVEIDPTSSADCGKKFIVLGKREASLQILTKRDKMLNQGQWCCASDGAFASSRGDTVKGDTVMVSSDSTLTDNCFKSGTSSEPCAQDSIMGDPSMSVDNNLYDYHLSQISQSESSLNFFDDGDKEYYGWPDIGNFEDVDKMFSGCDSTFGLGSLSNDADLGWFSPSTAIEGSENALRSSFKISCSGSTLLRSDLENHIDYGSQRDDNSPEESRKKSTGSYDSLRPQSTCIGEATSADSVQLVGGSEMKSENKEDSVPHEEVMNLPTKQTKRPNKLKGKKKEEYLENGASLQHCSLSKPILDAKASHTLSVQVTNFIASDYCHQVSQVSECPSLPSIKYVGDSHLSPRLKESSHASNQAWSTDPHGSSFEVPSGKNDGTVRAYNHHQLQASKARGLNHLDVLDATSPAAISDPVAVLKRMHRNVNDSDDHSEAGACAGVATGLDNSLAQETSSMSSMVDEISLEATSFRQLQQVMEKLDIRTKLCIRDSLYRLARSAEQRHNCLTPNFVSNNEEARDGDIILDDSNKCNTFMDVETDTNPIDRSVAHLLFHRPKDQNAMPGNDPVSPKTNTNAATVSLS